MQVNFKDRAAKRAKLSRDEIFVLDTEVLPTARRWLDIPGLRDQAISTLNFWGEAVPDGMEAAA
ncbi:MAG: hypothetical protein AAGB04_31480 [Pseudomonadota bacterium]